MAATGIQATEMYELAGSVTPGMSAFGTEPARLMQARGLGVRELARQVPCNPGHISNLRSGKAQPSAGLAADLDKALRAGGRWPRWRPDRAGAARLDLSLALIAAGRHDEAAGTALQAITSGRIVPSNYWRAREVIHAVARRGLPEASDLAEAYHEACGEDGPPALH